MQIYNNLNILVGEKPGKDLVSRNADDATNLPGMLPKTKTGRWVMKPKKQYCPTDCWWPPIGHEDTWDEKEGTWFEDELCCSEGDYEPIDEAKHRYCACCGAIMENWDPATAQSIDGED